MSSSSVQEQWIALCKATLETWCHLLLYVRQVYPLDTFTSTRFLGVPCKANRHARVVEYITNFVEIAAPAMASGSIREVSLVIMKNHFQELERFLLTFDDIVIDEKSVSLEHTERGMRNLLLAVLALEGAFDNDNKLGDDASFKLTMKTTNNVGRCKELKQALDGGTWHCPSKGNDEESMGTIRPLHHGRMPHGIIQMNLVTDQT